MNLGVYELTTMVEVSPPKTAHIGRLSPHQKQRILAIKGALPIVMLSYKGVEGRRKPKIVALRNSFAKAQSLYAGTARKASLTPTLQRKEC